MDDAQDLIQVVIIDREFCVGRLGYQVNDFGEVDVGLHSDDLGTRDHDLANQHFPEIKYRHEHFAFISLNDALLCAGIHDHAQLFYRVHKLVSRCRLDADQTQDCIPCAVQQPDRWLEDFFSPQGGFRHHQGGVFRVLQGDRLRRQFANHYMQKCDDRKCDRSRNGMRYLGLDFNRK